MVSHNNNDLWDTARINTALFYFTFLSSNFHGIQALHWAGQFHFYVLDLRLPIPYHFRSSDVCDFTWVGGSGQSHSPGWRGWLTSLVSSIQTSSGFSESSPLWPALSDHSILVENYSKMTQVCKTSQIKQVCSFNSLQYALFPWHLLVPSVQSPRGFGLMTLSLPGPGKWSAGKHHR